MITDTSPAVRRISFARFERFPRLFSTYCTDYAAVSSFYAGDFRQDEARRTAARRAAGRARSRDAVAEVLLEQNDRWNADDRVHRHIEALRDEEAVAVVTGQQVGLLSGPLYTAYKTITALQLAAQLQEEAGRPVVPVFWLEGEDHDFEEVASLQLLRRNERVSVRYEHPMENGAQARGPVGELVLTDEIHAVLQQIDEVLPPSDFKEAVMESARAAYRPGTTLLDAFACFLRVLFPDDGLVFIDPSDARLKRISAPLFRREIEGFADVHRRIEDVSRRLEAEGYHAQIQPRPTNLFLLEEEGRLALDAEDGQFVVRGTERAFTRDELLALLGETPERFSPNVVLRPLMQDTLLPTAVYVAGPSEVSYFAQLKPAYEWAELPMPLVYPRASVSLVEGKVQKVLDKYGLAVPDVGQDTSRLFQRLVVEGMDVDVDEAFAEATRPVHEAVNALKPTLEAIDRTLVQAAEATRAALMQEVESLKAKAVRAEKRNQDEVHAQLEKARANLFPGGMLQERALSPLYFMNKYSPELLSTLRQRLSLDTTAHQVVEL